MEETMTRQTTQKLITALYPRLSHDDEKSNRRKAKLFFWGRKKRGIIKQRTPERGVLCWWRGKRKEKVRTKTSRKKPQQKMRKNI